MNGLTSKLKNSSQSKKQFHFAWHLAAIFIISLVLRWGYLSGYHIELENHMTQFHLQHPTSAFMFGDADLYYSEAVSFLKSGHLGLPYRPPLTTAALAGAMFLKTTFLTAHLWQILLGSLISVLFAILTHLWFNRRTGILTGWLTTLAFPLLVLSGTLASETLLLTLLASALILLENKHSFSRPAAGFFLGLCILTRAETALFVGVLLIWQLLFEKRFVLKIRVLVPLLIFCTVFPWSMRNYLLLNSRFPDWPLEQKIVLISANGPLNFYLGNGPMASGGYRSFQAATRNSANADSVNFNDPIQRNAFHNGYNVAADYLSFRPERIQPLLAKKLEFYCRGLRTGFGVRNFPWGLRGYLHRGDIWTPNNSLPAYFLIICSSLGFLIAKKQKKYVTWLCGLFVCSGFVSTLVFFGLARNAVMLLPFLFMGISALIDNLLQKLSCNDTKSMLRRSFNILFILFILGSVVQAIQQSISPRTITTSNHILNSMDTVGDENYTRRKFLSEYEKTLDILDNQQELIIYEESLSAFIIGLAYTINGDDPERVERLIERALKINPSNADAWKLRGVQAMKEPDQLIVAIRALERYLEINPWADDADQIREYISRSKHEF